jgi:hypothetical protein
MIASHAVKQGKRYRYYIEQRLVQDDGVGTKGARYAAIEVEQAVIGILQRILKDPVEIVAALGVQDLSPGSLKRIVGKAKALSDDLKDHHKAQGLISEVIEKVVVHQDALEMRIRLPELALHLGTETGSEDPTHSITSPCKLARRGQDLKFILPLLEDSNAFSRKDPALIQAVAKAHLWWEWIKLGEVESLTEIARRDGIDKAKVTRLLRLAFLSPQTLRHILNGKQPVSATVRMLTKVHELPTSWAEQETLLASFD